MSIPSRVDNIKDQRFGSWTVVSYYCCSVNASVWNCVCICGQEKQIAATSLKSGRSKSCGCTRPIGSQWTVEQNRASKRKYKKNNPEKTKEYAENYMPEYRVKNKANIAKVQRKHRYQSLYGVTIEQIE